MKKLSSASIYKTSQRLDLCWVLTLHEQNIHAGKESSLTTTAKKKSQAIYVLDYKNKNVGTDVFPNEQERDGLCK